MDFTGVDGFDWDEGNINKNLLKHNVTNAEAEEIFKNYPIIVPSYYTEENRFLAIGVSFNSKILTAVFTIRKNKIRIISVRPASKKEINEYDNFK
ncbi:MAG TPA: hypothetical protein DIS94_02040 [Bacteroidetes bacterium]|nr:hypothetical protein [Bacteroidota bacterium]